MGGRRAHQFVNDERSADGERAAMELQIAEGARGRSLQPAGNDTGQLAADFPPPPGTDTSGPAYRDGLFSRIVAVNFPRRIIFGTGLAVEFFDGAN